MNKGNSEITGATSTELPKTGDCTDVVPGDDQLAVGTAGTSSVPPPSHGIKGCAYLLPVSRMQCCEVTTDTITGLADRLLPAASPYRRAVSVTGATARRHHDLDKHPGRGNSICQSKAKDPIERKGARGTSLTSDYSRNRYLPAAGRPSSLLPAASARLCTPECA